MRTLLILLLAAPALAQPSVLPDAASGTITGIVTWDETGEPLIGANVYLPALQRGAPTDSDGRFSIADVPPGVHEIRVSYTGFATRTFAEVELAAGETVALTAALTAQGFDCEFLICGDEPLLVRSPYQARVVAGAAQGGWCTTMEMGATYARGK